MTTIILVILGVLLAAAAALMMYFYGGDVFGKYNEEAEAGRLVSESAQIEAAMELYYQNEGKYPAGDAMDTLIEADYLAQPPHGYKDDANGEWVVDYDYGQIRSTVGAADDDAIAARREVDAPQLVAAQRLLDVAERLELARHPRKVPQVQVGVGAARHKPRPRRVERQRRHAL